MGNFGYEYDPDKNAANLERHGLDFDDAALIWDSPTLEEEDSRRDYGEVRIRAVGIVNGLIVTVIYTLRGSARRIISARKANRHERRKYREKISG